MNESIQALLEGAQVWRAREKGAMPAMPRRATRPAGGVETDAGETAADARALDDRASCDPRDAVLPTGWPALDDALPDGGWPLGTLVELLLPAHGVGELQLLVPALRAAGARSLSGGSSGGSSGWLAWIAPPLAPYPPALAQAGLDPARVLLVDARDDAGPSMGDGAGAVLAELQRGARVARRRGRPLATASEARGGADAHADGGVQAARAARAGLAGHAQARAGACGRRRRDRRGEGPGRPRRVGRVPVAA